MIQLISVLFLPQFSDKFSQIICNKSIVICKMLRTEFGNLPPRNVAMHAIKKCGIRTHFGWKRIKQARGFEQHIHTLIDISYKHH